MWWLLTMEHVWWLLTMEHGKQPSLVWSGEGQPPPRSTEFFPTAGLFCTFHSISIVETFSILGVVFALLGNAATLLSDWSKIKNKDMNQEPPAPPLWLTRGEPPHKDVTWLFKFLPQCNGEPGYRENKRYINRKISPNFQGKIPCSPQIQ